MKTIGSVDSEDYSSLRSEFERFKGQLDSVRGRIRDDCSTFQGNISKLDFSSWVDKVATEVQTYTEESMSKNLGTIQNDRGCDYLIDITEAIIKTLGDCIEQQKKYREYKNKYDSADSKDKNKSEYQSRMEYYRGYVDHLVSYCKQLIDSYSDVKFGQAFTLPQYSEYKGYNEDPITGPGDEDPIDTGPGSGLDDGGGGGYVDPGGGIVDNPDATPKRTPEACPSPCVTGSNGGKTDDGESWIEKFGSLLSNLLGGTTTLAGKLVKGFFDGLSILGGLFKVITGDKTLGEWLGEVGTWITNGVSAISSLWNDTIWPWVKDNFDFSSVSNFVSSVQDVWKKYVTPFFKEHFSWVSNSISAARDWFEKQDDSFKHLTYALWGVGSIVSLFNPFSIVGKLLMTGVGAVILPSLAKDLGLNFATEGYPNGYVPVADLNSATNGSGVKVDDLLIDENLDLSNSGKWEVGLGPSGEVGIVYDGARVSGTPEFKPGEEDKAKAWLDAARQKYDDSIPLTEVPSFTISFKTPTNFYDNESVQRYLKAHPKFKEVIDNPTNAMQNYFVELNNSGNLKGFARDFTNIGSEGVNFTLGGEKVSAMVVGDEIKLFYVDKISSNLTAKVPFASFSKSEMQNYMKGLLKDNRESTFI